MLDEPGNKQFNAAEVEKRIHETEERGYARTTREAAAQEATFNTSSQPQLPTASSMVVQAGGATNIPLAKDSKLSIRVLTEKELHKGLGARIKHWGRAFREELEMAQEACGQLWPEKYKVLKLGLCLRGEAEEFFHDLRDEWWSTEKTLTYAMEEMESGFFRTSTSAQVTELFNR
uniref:RxLR effector candidate protein n=1 Tax=Hyaloperonospora arabidopsidis (strain Emoy2) TaxID=559515 RepID=M4C471_HYAAE